MQTITDNWFWPFILIEGQEIKLNDEEVEKIRVGYIYNPKTKKFEETAGSKAFEEKQKLAEVEQIKQKYSSIILAKYSLTDQLNMSNEALMINTSANIEQRAFTEKELLRFWEIKQAKVWIDEQRTLCAKEIATFLKK